MNKPLNIVVADDNKDAAESLAEVVTLWGHTAHTCLRPELTLECCRLNEPDVLLLDIRFPLRTDGLQIAHKAKRMCDAMIIGMSGFVDDEIRVQAEHAGFNHVYTKPLNLKHLRGLFDKLGTYV